MFCSKCGKEIIESASFCQYCGNPVEGSKAIASGSEKSTSGSLLRSFQEKAKNVSESINAAAEETQKKTEEGKTKKENLKEKTKGVPSSRLKDRFKEECLGNFHNIIVDRFTGVNYLFQTSWNHAGGLTVLVDENGKPLITKEDIIKSEETEEN